jgi:hypothetical protein
VDELRRLRFSARCSEWGADRTTRILGRSDADPSFKELWQAWLRLNSSIRPLIETIDKSGLEFHPVTTGYEAVRETVSPAEAWLLLQRRLTRHPAPQSRERRSTMSSFQDIDSVRYIGVASSTGRI